MLAGIYLRGTIIFPFFMDLPQELPSYIHGNEYITPTISIDVFAVFLIKLIHLGFFLLDQHILPVFIKVVFVFEFHFERFVVRKLYLKY